MGQARGMRRPLALAAALLLAGSLAACGSDDDGEEDAGTGGDAFTRVVEAGDFAFEPTTLEIESGRAVTIELHNTDQVTHSLTIDDLDVDEVAEGGATVRARVSPEPGSYPFRCKFHAQMTGTLTVT